MNTENVEATGFYFPSYSQLVSKNLYLFLKDYFKVVDLFFFTVKLASHVDKATLAASKALIPIAKDDAEKKRLQNTIENPDRAFNKLLDFSSLNSKNLTVNTVDAFLWFVSSTVQSAMRKRPEMVKSSEQIKVEDIFDFRNKKELVNYLIDRKINSLSYGGLSKIEKYLSETMGVDMFKNQAERELVQIFLEVRNIQVHNRGYVNRVFLSRIVRHDDYGFEEGKRLHLDFDDICKFAKACIEVALALDAEVCLKFSIERKKYSTWDRLQ